MTLTLNLILLLMFHQSADRVHPFIEDFEIGILVKESVTSGHLLWRELFGCLAQGGQCSALPVDLRGDAAHHLYTVLVYEPDSVEAVSNDFGVWEPPSSELSVGAGEVDTDQPNALAALE